MPKPRRHLSINVECVDKQILALFPSINFYSDDIDKQRKRGMKTSLRVLYIAADEGYVNRYMLSKKHEFGGDSIKRALDRLERLELLRTMPPKLTTKRVERIDYVLTIKGVVACISFPRFQQVKQLNGILLRFQDNLVIRTLILFNTLSKPGDGTQTSFVMHHIRQLSDQGVNLEQKSEDAIHRDLLTIDEIRIAEHFDPIFKWFEMFSNLDPKTLREVKKSFSSMIESAISCPEAYKMVIDLLREFFFFLLCPEFQAWLRTNPDYERAKEMIEKFKEIIFSEVKIGKDGVITDESLYELLLNEDSKAKRSRIIHKLRELFASEVTRKVNEIVKSLNKKK